MEQTRLKGDYRSVWHFSRFRTSRRSTVVVLARRATRCYDYLPTGGICEGGETALRVPLTQLEQVRRRTEHLIGLDRLEQE